MVKTRGMESNEVFYFQTPEIQEFEKCVMNCVFLLYSVILRNFASMTSTGFLIILTVYSGIYVLFWSVVERSALSWRWGC